MADNMVLPFTRGQITCYCPCKMLLPWGQITRCKLCFYYTCKFGVISIKHVITAVMKVKADIIASTATKSVSTRCTSDD